MKVSIVVIGDELLIGQVTDTNSGFIARHIAPYGWEVDNIQVVSDTAEAIKQGIEQGFQKSNVVLTTGGLGPTKDDITKQTLCDIFEGTLKESAEVLENIREVFRKRGLELNRLTAAQAMVPDNAVIIQNPVGTAPIMWFERNAATSKQVLVAMPGVPFETEHVFTSSVFPKLLETFPQPYVITHRTMLVTGISESALAARLEDWEEKLPPQLHLAYLPKSGIIRLRLDGHSSNKTELEEAMDANWTSLKELCGDNLLCEGDFTPAEILLKKLISSHQTVATAESCTGGNIARLITSIPGASQAMNGGVVAYSNEVKTNLLGVKEDSLTEHGAVSIPVVEQMAAGACKALGTDIAIATSGIAGPGGGTYKKPVGTVCIAVATANGKTVSQTYHFPGNRERIVDRASTMALIMAIRLL
ncbi:MAG: competence/damage-inducible protein A [Firmicutes bacterium]|nr:competence/damage-inducible protein A [Bacillota bacterium]MCM1401873.1 competence/damage-inducible protein A [Bacteroides sp.]MCM1476728.1 competence/damage-inducible protein A [Bacteroides sp.]